MAFEFKLGFGAQNTLIVPTTRKNLDHEVQNEHLYAVSPYIFKGRGSNDYSATTPLEDGQCAPEFPREIGFYSGNPEVTNGIVHFYKKNERKELKEGPSDILCLLAVPASVSCHDLMGFVAPCQSEIRHIRIVRDGSPNQFMVILAFRSKAAALQFYQSYNGASYNLLEPDSLCHAVWVSEIERGGDGVPPAGHTELPNCPVCLERMDESCALSCN